MSEDFKDLIPGDKVIVGVGYVGERLGEVARVTEKEIVVDDGFRFDRLTGEMVRQQFDSPRLKRKATENDRKELRRDYLMGRLMGLEVYRADLTNSDIEDLEELNRAVDAMLEKARSV